MIENAAYKMWIVKVGPLGQMVGCRTARYVGLIFGIQLDFAHM